MPPTIAECIQISYLINNYLFDHQIKIRNLHIFEFWRSNQQTVFAVDVIGIHDVHVDFWIRIFQHGLDRSKFQT